MVGSLLEKMLNRPAVGSLLVTRAVYAVNWYCIAALFSVMAIDLHQNISGLGIVTASFFLGIGLLQIPAGMVVARHGAKKAVVGGMALSSLTALLIGVSPEFYVIVLLRFLAGVGMAFVFSPSVVLIARYHRKGSEGLGIGLYNSAFNMGAAFGLFGWAVLGELLGWRLSLDILGVMGLASTVLALAFLPSDVPSARPAGGSRVMKILRDRQLLLISIVSVGLGSGPTVIGNFVVYYLHESLSVPLGLAGVVGGLSMLCSLVSSPMAGRLHDKSGRFKRILYVSGALMAVGLGLAAYSVWGAVLASILVGLGGGSGLTLSFILAREMKEIEPEYQTLAVAWLNAINLAGSFAAPILFTYFVLALGYQAGWILSGVYVLVFLLPVVWLKEKGAGA